MCTNVKDSVYQSMALLGVNSAMLCLKAKFYRKMHFCRAESVPATSLRLQYENDNWGIIASMMITHTTLVYHTIAYHTKTGC